jgi:hypothetical protein
MWIFWTVLSFMFISSAQFVNRYYGMCWTSYLIYTSICVFVTGWSLPLSYQLAPSLLHPWFLGIGFLSILGFLGSIFIFHDIVSIWSYVGAVIVLIGSGIMMIK